MHKAPRAAIAGLGVAAAAGLAVALLVGGAAVSGGAGCDSAEEPCVPRCDGLACGDDGCGGVCGTCEGAATCQAGACVCVPDCSGKFCADDGCGQACFDCPGGFACGETDRCDSVDDSEAYVPDGSFAMGCNAAVDSKCGTDESPARLLTLPAYAVDRREVTVAAFRACVDAGTCDEIKADQCAWGESTWLSAGSDQRPVTCVDHARAVAYCAWRGAALCTEAQWEKAARGGCETSGLAGSGVGSSPEDCGPDSRIFPWGTGEPKCDDAIMKLCATEQSAHEVGSRERDTSVYGALDMAGNVREWTADWYSAAWYTNAPEGEVGGPASGAFRAVRGGSFADVADALRLSDRTSEVPNADRGYPDLGFRCCRAFDAP
jgi:sulfatase modifying factor 1